MKRARWVLLGIVLLGCAFSVGTLFYLSQGGGISPPNLTRAVRALLELDLPLIGVLAGFLFARTRATKTSSDVAGSLVFAASIVAVHCFGPGVLLFVVGDVNQVLVLLGLASPSAQAISVAGLTFFFSKTS
jgi:hypothetical protein